MAGNALPSAAAVFPAVVILVGEGWGGWVRLVAGLRARSGRVLRQGVSVRYDRSGYRAMCLKLFIFIAAIKLSVIPLAYQGVKLK